MRTTSNTKRLGAFSVLVGVAVMLSGCTASVNTTVAAADVAKVGAKALSTEWDTDATMDCGDESVDSVEGTEVECVAYNPKSGLDYPATVTLKTIKGSEYTVSVVTGSPITPESDETDADAEDGESTDGTDDSSAAPADAPTVSGDSLAGVAAPALAAKLGYSPVIDCGTEPIPIYLDAKIQCVVTADDGTRHAGNIVITAVTSTNYDLDIDMMAATLD